MLRRMGPLQGVLKMIPGLGKQLDGVDVDEGSSKRVEAIVLSMTPHERAVPHVIDGRRRQRIARGSRHDGRAGQPAARGPQEMEKMMKQMGKGKMPRFPADAGGAGMARRRAPRRAGSARSERKKKAKRRSAR